MIYLLIGYMWLFIHRPFEIWPWLAAVRIERVYMLITIAYWLAQPKAWTANRLNTGVGLLVTSILVSALVSPYEGLGSQAVQDWLKLLVFYILVLTSVRNLDDLKVLIVGFVTIMGLYELHSLREYLNGRGEWRMGTWRMVGVGVAKSDPNSFAASVLYGLPLLLPVTTLATQKWQHRALWGALVLGLTCVFLTGSRTAFAALVCLGAFFAMLSPYRWRIVALLLVACPLVWFSLSEKLQNRYLTLIDPSYGPSNAEVSAESREQFFFMAVDIWKENPLFGVGPRGFAYASGTGMQSHSLYAETISEEGLLGVVAVIVLVVGYYLNFRKARELYQAAEPTTDVQFLYRTVLATSLAVSVLLFLGLGGHNLLRYNWLWYAAFTTLAINFLQKAVAEQNSAEITAKCESLPVVILDDRNLLRKYSPRLRESKWI